MSFWMRKQTYFNQGFKGRAFQSVTLGERGQLIATFDVMFGLSFGFDATAWKRARSLCLSHTHFITHTVKWKTTERSESSQCCNLHKVFASTSSQPFSQLQPPTSPLLHHWDFGRSTQTWQRRDLRILFIILGLNVHGHADPQSTIHLPVLKYEPRLDQRYVQSSPTILQQVNPPNTQSQISLVLIITVLTAAEGGGVRGIYIVNCVWQGGVSGFVVACL